jgi:hypothetical protein
VSIDIRKIPVYCIVAPGEGDRLEKFLGYNGFEDVRTSPGVMERKKVTGVAKAHMIALEKALAECDGPFVILENDVDIYNTDMKVSIPDGADAVYLGVSMWGLRNGHGELGMISGERNNGGLYRMYNMLAAHAVLYLNRDYAEFLLSAIPLFIKMETNQDKLRAETMKYWNIYAQNYPIFYQKGKYQRYTKIKLASQTMRQLSVYYL